MACPPNDKCPQNTLAYKAKSMSTDGTKYIGLIENVQKKKNGYSDILIP